MRELGLAGRERQLVSDARERDAQIALKQRQQEKRLAEKGDALRTHSLNLRTRNERARRNWRKTSGKSGYRLYQATTIRHRPLIVGPHRITPGATKT